MCNAMVNNVVENFIAYSVGPGFFKEKNYRNKRCSGKNKENNKRPIIKKNVFHLYKSNECM